MSASHSMSADHSPMSPSLQAATRDLPESWAGSARMRVRAAAASSRAELKYNVPFENLNCVISSEKAFKSRKIFYKQYDSGM